MPQTLMPPSPAFTHALESTDLTSTDPQRDSFDFTGRTVLLATDGSPSSVAAAHVAYALAREKRAIVHAVTVMNTRPEHAPAPLDLALALTCESDGESTRTHQIALLRDTLSATLGVAVHWPVRIMIGELAPAIVQEANRIHATLIVIGLRRHGPLDRIMHDETTLSVVRRARCPVLGVASTLHGLPTRVLAALDFGRSSETAARRGAGLLAEDGSMVLAYVAPQSGDGAEEGEALIRELGVAAAFDRCEEELPRSVARLDRVVVHHKLPQPTAKLLLEYAVTTRADLVVAGSRRQRRMDRWLLGSVSTELVRDGRRSVLIVPPEREGDSPARDD